MPSFTSAVKVISGEHIAKSSCGYPLEVRAADAVRWLKGEVVIAPTAKLACEVFRISYPRLKRAQARLVQGRHHFDEKHVNGNGNGATATALSDAVLDHMVIEIGPDRILHALDRVTSPELPLQAAE
jgi:hypothetical protein